MSISFFIPIIAMSMSESSLISPFEVEPKSIIVCVISFFSMLFYANKENKLFIELSKIYWRLRLKEFIKHIEKKLITQTIILFGSTSKGEIKEDSDIDIAIIGIKKDIDIKNFEARIKRKIQILWFKSMDEVKNNELKNSIINGVTLSGRLRL